MTSSQIWKNLEKKAAESLGGKRAGVTGQENPDVYHPQFEIECKYRASLAFVAWFQQVEKFSKKSGKIPLLVCKQKQARGEYVILKMEDFKRLIDGTNTL